MKILSMIVLSTGWLLPAYLGISSYLAWAEAEVWPLLRGEHPMNSFPHLRFCQQMLALSVTWLAVALAVWTVLLLRRQKSSPAGML